MRKSYKYRVVSELETSGETREKRFDGYEEMLDYLGFVVMVAQKVEVYFKVGGEWALVKEMNLIKII